MKLKWIQRFILIFGAFLVFLIGLAGILVLSGTVEFSIPDPIEHEYYSWQRLTACGCGLYLMLYALYVFFYRGKYYYSNKDFIVQRTEGGDLLISGKAIESLVQADVFHQPRFAAEDDGVAFDDVEVEGAGLFDFEHGTVSYGVRVNWAMDVK